MVVVRVVLLLVLYMYTVRSTSYLVPGKHQNCTSIYYRILDSYSHCGTWYLASSSTSIALHSCFLPTPTATHRQCRQPPFVTTSTSTSWVVVEDGGGGGEASTINNSTILCSSVRNT